MYNFQPGKLAPVETAVPRDKFVGVMEGVGRAEKICDDAVAGFGGELSIFKEGAAREMKIAPARTATGESACL